MKPVNLYEGFNRFVVRIAAQSYDVLDDDFWEDPESWCLQRLFNNDGDDPDETRDRLMEAVAVASPSLMHAWQRELKHDVTSRKKTERTTSSLIQYLIRTCTRPTPFGLFAGVGLGSVSDSSEGMIHSLSAHRKYVRPSYSWTVQLASLISDQSGAIFLKANPDSLLVEDRLYFSTPDVPKKSVRTGSIRANKLAKLILEYTQQPQAIEQIEELCAASLPSAYHDRIPGFIREMEAAGVLLRCLAIGVTTYHDPTNPLAIDRDAMQGIADEDFRGRIERANSKLAEINTERMGASLKAILEVEECLQSFDIDAAPRLRGDLVIAVDCKLPAAVIEKAEKASELLLRLSSVPAGYWHVTEFLREFTERYGTNVKVPLLEVLSEFSGLGPLAGYGHPARSWPWHPYALQQPPDGRDQHLLRIATSAIRDSVHSYELTEYDIEQLTIDPQWQTSAPKTMEIFCSIAAENASRIDSGEFTLVVSPIGGKSPAGQAIGRFVGGLQESALSYLDGLEQFEGNDDSVIQAEAVYTPPDTDIAGALQRRHPYDYEIIVDGTRPSVDASHCILPADIDVSVDARGNIKLYSGSHGRQVVPRNTHRVSSALAPNVARFLSDIVDHRQSKPRSFDWGAAACLDFTPRLHWQGIVLAPASWQFRLANELAFDAFEVMFRDWCTKWRVPARVLHAVSDNRLVLDLTCSWSLHYLFRQLNKLHGSIVLQELLPSSDQLWIKDQSGRRYASEMVIPLRLRPPVSSPESQQPQSAQAIAPIDATKISSVSNVFVPGSAWLFFKVYLPEYAHDQWLDTSFRAILKDLEEGIGSCPWFFMRYRDPSPHLRLRFKVEEDGRQGELFNVVTKHFKETREGTPVVGRLMMDTYRRETDRYGGPVSIEYAEEIFATQSIQALAFLRNRNGQSEDRVTDAMVELLQFGQLFENSGCDPQRLWPSDFWPDGPPKLSATERKMYRRAISVVRSTEDSGSDCGSLQQVVSNLAELHGGTTDPNSVLPSIFSSMVHMQCNRLIGMDPASEMSIRNVIYRTVKAKHLSLGES